MEYAKFARQHAYARRNGYLESYDEYVTLQFKGYVKTCKRNGILPMSRKKWEAAQ